MAKILKCRDLGMDCDVDVRATTAAEMLLRAAEHVQPVQGRQEIPQDVVAKLRAARG